MIKVDLEKNLSYTSTFYFDLSRVAKIITNDMFYEIGYEKMLQNE